MDIPTGAYERSEYFLGIIRGFRSAETNLSSTNLEINLIDGWVSDTTRSEDGIVWNISDRRPSTVRTALDAARTHEMREFVVRAHLAWLAALTSAGMGRKAGAQRRALFSALARHGLALAA